MAASHSPDRRIARAPPLTSSAPRLTGTCPNTTSTVLISRRLAKTEVGASVRSAIHRGRATSRMPEFVISTALSSPTATYGRSRSTAHRDSPRSAGTGGSSGSASRSTPATTNTAPPARSSAVYTARDPASSARPPATVPTEKPT